MSAEKKEKKMRLVQIESPFAGKGSTPEEVARGTERNKRYLDRCIRDCLRRGESPIASHKMLTDALNDLDPGERELGIKAGFEWRTAAAATVVYTDHGVSGGMKLGIEHAESLRREQPHEIEYRQIGAEPERARGVTVDPPKPAPTEKDLVEASRVTALAMIKAAAYCTEMVEKDPIRGAEWAQAAATLTGRAF